MYAVAAHVLIFKRMLAKPGKSESSNIKHTIRFILLKPSVETGKLHLPRKEPLVQGAELRAVNTTILPSFSPETNQRKFGRDTSQVYCQLFVGIANYDHWIQKAETKPKGPYFFAFLTLLGLDGWDFSGFVGASVFSGFAGPSSFFLSKNCLDFLGNNPNIGWFFFNIICNWVLKIENWRGLRQWLYLVLCRSGTAGPQAGHVDSLNHLE